MRSLVLILCLLASTGCASGNCLRQIGTDHPATSATTGGACP